MSDFKYVKEGDVVTRMVAGTTACRLKITSVDDEYLYSNVAINPENGDEDPISGVPWAFSRDTGAEHDPSLDLGKLIVSHLVHEDGSRHPSIHPENIASREEVMGAKMARLMAG